MRKSTSKPEREPRIETKVSEISLRVPCKRKALHLTTAQFLKIFAAGLTALKWNLLIPNVDKLAEETQVSLTTELDMPVLTFRSQDDPGEPFVRIAWNTEPELKA